METTDILQTIRQLQRDFQSVAPDNLAGLSAQLEDMRNYFDTTAPRVRYGAIAHALDPDAEIDRELETTGQAISQAYHAVRRGRARRGQAPAAGIAAVYGAARAAYAAVVRLQWEIGAHDVELIPGTAGHAAPA
jgi:hypothetical protein